MKDPQQPLDEAESCLLELLHFLSAEPYCFVTPTPMTHRSVLERAPKKMAENLRDIFGWSLPFQREKFPEIAALLDKAGCLEQSPDRCRSTVRVSTIDHHLFLHSAFPTVQADAVFFGPDTYRFVAFIKRHLPKEPLVGEMVDIGAGSGAGGIIAANLLPGSNLSLCDLNPKALRLSRINAQFAGIEAHYFEMPGASKMEKPIGLALCNPPYMAGKGDRIYRDGGEMHGAQIALDWAHDLMPKLAPNGLILLYTGAAIIEGKDPLSEHLACDAEQYHCQLEHYEIDPDIFGTELNRAAYADVERIAAKGYMLRKAA